MKKISVILSLALLVSLLSAIEFNFDGEMRQRAALANNAVEKDGGWADSRMQLGIESQLHQDLSFRIGTQIGDIVWGNGGGGISTGEALQIKEAFLKYNINAFDAALTIGQQYWKDKMGLVMDDYFSGMRLEKEDFFGFNTEMVLIKALERNTHISDDYTVVVLHGNMQEGLPLGMYAMYGNDAFSDASNLTLYPYISFDAAPFKVDAAAFLDMQMVGKDTEMGMGAAFKGKMDMDVLEVGADLLFAAKNGLTTISPWYQNGLYIYGIGKHHDGVNLYWNDPYSGNADAFISAVVSAKAPIKENLSAFAAAGFLTDLGMEINGGIECELIPDLLNLNVIGAVGKSDGDTKNYFLGSSLKMEF